MAFNLFNKTPDAGAIDGDFPEGKYLDKSAGIPGSPVQADMRNDIYIFFSKIFKEVGAVFNDVADTVNASQFFTTFADFLKPVVVNALDGVPITVPTHRHFTVYLDTSLGDATIPNFAGAFEGQRCMVISEGIADAINEGGNGDYVNDVFISPESSGLSYKKTWINGSWKAVNEVTAEIAVTGQVSRLHSTGYMVLNIRDGNDVAVITVRGALFSSGTFTPTVFNIPFDAPPKGSGKLISQNAANFAWSESRETATATEGETMRLLSTVSIPSLTYAKIESYEGYYS